MKKTGLYIHVPFCIRKCPYCDFYSVTEHDGDIFKKYARAVAYNIEHYLEVNGELSFDTVYFGGGTPSLMSAEAYKIIIDAIKEYCDTEKSEITMEMNPKTADYNKLRYLRELGINRISVGVQSTDDEELRYLGRIHSYSEAEQAVLTVHSAGFENISVDFMTGIRGQNMQSMLKSIEKLTALPVRHISAYMLKIEEGTPYGKSDISAFLPDEDEVADMYLAMIKALEEKGFHQYEISNFSVKGYESRHNLKYWNSEEYIGIGPSAHSYFGGKRYEVPGNFKNFLENKYQTEIINEENPGDFFEKAMLRLRLTEGLDLSLFPEYAETVFRKSQKFIKSGLINRTGSNIRLTPEGFLVSNSIISDILFDF